MVRSLIHTILRQPLQPLLRHSLQHTQRQQQSYRHREQQQRRLHGAATITAPSSSSPPPSLPRQPWSLVRYHQGVIPLPSAPLRTLSETSGSSSSATYQRRFFSNVAAAANDAGSRDDNRDVDVYDEDDGRQPYDASVDDAALGAVGTPLRHDALRDTLLDSFGRRHTYLRVSLTERCNLRCTYCMPPEGVTLTPDTQLLSTAELSLLQRFFLRCGITKIRYTGGEPTVRRDLPSLIASVTADGRAEAARRRWQAENSVDDDNIDGSSSSSSSDSSSGHVGDGSDVHGGVLTHVCITTNAIRLARHLPALMAAGLTHVNISLDTLDAAEFERVTRRRGHQRVLDSIEMAADYALSSSSKSSSPLSPSSSAVTPPPSPPPPSALTVKVNVVVIRGFNDHEVLDFVAMTRDRNIEIRFIEYMPFDGNQWDFEKLLPYQEMLDTIRARHPSLRRLGAASSPTSTETETETVAERAERRRHGEQPDAVSKLYKIDGHVGRIGFITSMTHHFCRSCSRLRLTADGNLKVCLFGPQEVSLRDVVRSDAFARARALDEAAAAAAAAADDDTTTTPRDPDQEQFRLLARVVRRAVWRKRRQHAGMFAIKKMSNRPMITIGG